MTRAARVLPLIANPNAGLGRSGRALPEVVRCLEDLGWRAQVHITDRAGEAAALAERLCRSHERLLVVGGDGTVHAMLPALAGSRAALGLMPIGSSNGAARELGIPRSIAGMCAVAAGEKVRAVDLGRANGEPFILMAGVGFDAQVVRNVGLRAKQRLGALAYAAQALRHAAKAPVSRLRVSAGEQRMEVSAWMAVVANMATYTYVWKGVPGADCADGLLDICVFEAGNAAETAGQVGGALVGRHLRHPLVRHLAAPQFEIECDPALPVQLDGDEAGQTPLRVEVMPQALRVLVP